MATNMSSTNYHLDKARKIGQSVMDFFSGCLRTITILHSHIHEGKAFEIYKVVTALANNGHTYFEIKTSADEELHLKEINMWISEGPVLLTIVEAPTLTTGATPFVPVNLNRKLKDGAVILSGTTVKVNPTGISGGVELKAFRFGIGGVGAHEHESIIGSERERVFKPDTTYLLDLQNLSGGNIDLTFDAIWYEE